MNSEKYRSLKIVQMVLITASIIVTSISIIEQIMGEGILLYILLDLCKTICLFCGAIYMMFDSKKDGCSISKIQGCKERCCSFL